MLLRSRTAPAWQGEPVTADDSQERLIVAAENLGLVQYNDHDLSSWKYEAQGSGNWLLGRLIAATCLAAFFLFLAALTFNWSTVQTSLVFIGLIAAVALEVCLLGTRWRTEFFGPEDPEAPPLTPDLQAIVDGMTDQWRQTGQWPLGFAAEFLMQPLWHRRRICIFQIHGASRQTRLIAALRREN